MTRQRLLVGLLAGSLFTACFNPLLGQGSPSNQVSLAGAWEGTFTGTRSGAANLQLTIDQSETALMGSWSVSFPERSRNNRGSLTGQLTGQRFTVDLESEDARNCGFKATGSVKKNGNELEGSYKSTGPGKCDGSEVGFFGLKRQKPSS